MQSESAKRNARAYYARNRDRILANGKAKRKAMTLEENEEFRAADRARHRAIRERRGKDMS